MAVPLETPVRPPRTWVRILLGVIVALLAAMWIYGFFFASKEAVSRLDDRSWAVRAEPICRAANEERDELADSRRITESGPNALAERADIIDEATVIITRMVDALVVVRPTGPEDTRLLDTWEDFYRQLIEDRIAYTATLRTGENEPFRESALEGVPISDWINDFAVVNEIDSCAAPLDLSI